MKLKKVSFLLLLCSMTFFAQTNIKYGPDYLVIEAEDTNLNNLWKVVKKGDINYRQYDYFSDSNNSPEPINDTYLQYTGPWQGAGSDIEYKFVCPKTGQYQMAMRLLCPLREAGPNAHKFKYINHPDTGVRTKWEAGDARNDFFVKMEGNFTSAVPWITDTDGLKQYIKFYGRGENRWGSCINLEYHPSGSPAKHGPAIYNFIEGEEYTFHLKGRSSTAIIDYIVFYNKSYVPHQNINHGTDLAQLLPSAMRPYNTLTGLNVIASSSGNLRQTTTGKVSVETVPSGAFSEVTWSSSDPSIVSVDQDGNTTALGNIGDKVTITATSKLDSSITGSTEIEIVQFFGIGVSNVTITSGDVTIVDGTTESLVVTVSPEDADDKSVNWTSSNSDIASVDSSGVVTALASGSTTIRATSFDNSAIYDEVNVTVVPLVQPSVAFDDRQKYLTNEYGNAGTMEVSVDYNAGSLNTVTSMTLYLRHIEKGWARVVKDIKIDLTAADLPDPNSGTYTHKIPVDGITTAANLPEGDFYFLFVTMISSNGESKNQGANPVKIIQADLSVDAFDFEAETSVYPNPVVNGIVNVQSKGDLLGKIGVLYNLSGIPVSTTKLANDVNAIDVSSLVTGIYLLQISEGNKIIASKQIIVK